MVEKRIATIRDSDLAFQRKWDGAAVDAAYYLDMAKERGAVPFSLVHPEQILEGFVRWVASERGKEMTEWYGAVNKIEKSDEKQSDFSGPFLYQFSSPAQPVPLVRRDTFRKALETRENLRNGIVEQGPESERKEPDDPDAFLRSETFSKMSSGWQKIIVRSLALSSKTREFSARVVKMKPEDVVEEVARFQEFERQEQLEIWRLSRALDAEELAEQIAEMKREEARLQMSIAKMRYGTNAVVLSDGEKARIEEEKARSAIGKNF